MDINFINRNAMLGIVIGEQSYQGKGLGKEIMELGLTYAFDYLQLNKIYLDVLESNNKAVSLYKKLGFIEEGLFRNHYWFNNEFHNVMRFSIFK